MPGGPPPVAGPPGQLDLTIENNIVTSSGSSYKDYDLQVGDSGTVVSNNNLSSDATADDKGGSDHLINKSATNQFVNPTNDLTLKDTSDAKDAGKTISGFDSDALHDEADNWRPQGNSWDMGALELAVETMLMASRMYMVV